MSFKDVYDSLYAQLAADSTLLSYVNSSQFLKGMQDNYPSQEYTIILEPADENERENTEATRAYGSKRFKEVDYVIDVWARVILTGYPNFASVVGSADGTKKGVIQVVKDIKDAIRADTTLGYNRYGSSESAGSGSGNFALDSNNKNLSVSINGRTPTGCDAIFCGDSTLSGADVASQIQTSLRALSLHADDGYYRCICTFDGGTNKFTIRTDQYGPEQSVVVSAGASYDCSALLGFDSPTELVGRNIVQVKFGISSANNINYPVRYRTLPVMIREEVLVQ